MPSFELAGATLVGLDHRSPLKETNGQDALCVLVIPETVFGQVQICLVADGCGSGKHSEVGAKLGVRFLSSAIKRQLERAQLSEEPPRRQFERMLETARQEVLARMRLLAIDLGGSFSQTVNDYFLFTVVGAILSDTSCVFFSRGDGLIAVNDEEIWIEPEEGNAPIYLSYGLVETSLKARPQDLMFTIHRVINSERLQHFLIGTDGLRFLKDAQDLSLPGKADLVGSLSQFWEEDRYFRNPDTIRRRLSLINRSHQESDWDGHRLITHHGHLKDDVALITGRSRP